MGRRSRRNEEAQSVGGCFGGVGIGCSLLRKLAMTGQNNTCFKCHRPVLVEVPFQENSGSIGYISTGVLGQAGFYCDDCKLFFCGRCSGTPGASSENFQHQPGCLSITCPLCNQWVSSPLVPPIPLALLTKNNPNEGMVPPIEGGNLPPYVGWGVFAFFLLVMVGILVFFMIQEQ